MKFIDKLQTIILLLRCCKAQFDQDLYHPALRGYNSEVQNQYQNQYEISQKPVVYQRGYSNSDESGTCKCSCKKCEYKPKRCCRKVCYTCRKAKQRPARPQPSGFQPAGFQPIPASLLMIPYAMPFFVLPPKNETESNQKKETTKAEDKTTNKPEENSNNLKNQSDNDPLKDNDIMFPEKPPYIMRSTTYFIDPKYFEREKLKSEIYSKCSRNQCYGEFKESSMDYETRRSKYSVTLSKLHRKLEILHNIRPTIGVKEKDSGVTRMGRLPKYGLISLPGDISEKLMMQLMKTDGNK